MNLNCYKCKAEENLSVRATSKNGIKLMMCRPCRATAERNRIKKRASEKRQIDWSEDWYKLAKQINGRIIEKYAKR